jgi:hypothetical protein
MQRFAWIALLASTFTTTACRSTTTQASSSTAGGSPAKVAASMAPECSGSCDTQHSCVRAREDQLCGCEVVPHVSCGGVQTPNFSLPGQPMPRQWVCRPLHPLRDRGDGCPYAVPSAATACTGAAVCRYTTDACGRQTEQWSCVDKHWVQGQTLYTPPPP